MGTDSKKFNRAEDISDMQREKIRTNEPSLVTRLRPANRAMPRCPYIKGRNTRWAIRQLKSLLK